MTLAQVVYAQLIDHRSFPIITLWSFGRSIDLFPLELILIFRAVKYQKANYYVLFRSVFAENKLSTLSN